MNRKQITVITPSIVLMVAKDCNNNICVTVQKEDCEISFAATSLEDGLAKAKIELNIPDIDYRLEY